ncbi:type III secretion protein HrpB4 [Paraburkholderia sp. RL17-368-BIF-A]|uniref:type III secretion protein HrpB4 n=1 Tax=Paraburkholderia sp. RL17-368-BIF-A TaxID=3031628 RepID=UPI0038CBE050
MAAVSSGGLAASGAAGSSPALSAQASAGSSVGLAGTGSASSSSALSTPASTAFPAARSAPSPAAFPFSRAAAALAAWQRNANDAARWAHPSWWAPALDVSPATVSASFDALRDALASTGTGAAAACSRALLRAAGVPLPDFDSLRAPSPLVLDALPVDDALRVLRMRALLLRRAEVRRLIDKPSRRRLAEWIGMPLERLGAAPRRPGADRASANVPDVARLVARGHLPSLEELDAERLAYEGYALIARDVALSASDAQEAALFAWPRPCPLLRLALPRDLPPPWPATTARELDTGGTAFLFAQLPELLSEWAWLFG